MNFDPEEMAALLIQLRMIKFEQGDMSFEQALNLAVALKSEEEFLKVNDPVVKDAWERYQVILQLRRRNE